MRADDCPFCKECNDPFCTFQFDRQQMYEDEIVNMVDRMEGKDRLIAFEKRVADAFNAGEIKGPIHLAGGNEEELIRHFQGIGSDEWVFSTYRSHYHALLKGIHAD